MRSGLYFLIKWSCAGQPLDIVLVSLQAVEEAKELVARAITVEVGHQGFDFAERFLFHRQSGFEVDLSCLDRFVAQPQCNDRTIYSSSEHIESHCVSTMYPET